MPPTGVTSMKKPRVKTATTPVVAGAVQVDTQQSLQSMIMQLIGSSLTDVWGLSTDDIQAVKKSLVDVMKSENSTPYQRAAAAQAIMLGQQLDGKSKDRVVEIIKCGLLQQIAQNTKPKDDIVDDAALAAGLTRLLGVEGAA